MTTAVGSRTSRTLAAAEFSSHRCTAQTLLAGMTSSDQSLKAESGQPPDPSPLCCWMKVFLLCTCTRKSRGICSRSALLSMKVLPCDCIPAAVFSHLQNQLFPSGESLTSSSVSISYSLKEVFVLFASDNLSSVMSNSFCLTSFPFKMNQSLEVLDLEGLLSLPFAIKHLLTADLMGCGGNLAVFAFDC